MAVAVRSFGKINIGLCIGTRRPDGFHYLRTVYQTVALHDVIRIEVQRGTGIEIRTKDARVPSDETNTCWRVADRVLKTLKTRGKVVIALEKRLPVQGGVGAASSNAIATMLGLERALKQELAIEDRLRIASEVGSDLPLFLIGGTVLGVGRGEQVFPLQDLPEMHVVLATPSVGVSTAAAFADWDEQFGAEGARDKLTPDDNSDRINKFSQAAFAWLMGASRLAGAASGVPATSPQHARTGRAGDSDGGSRAETPLLDLVRAGIENDFERVVFPKYPELREVKRVLERHGARYASLSGSGSTVYGLFATSEQAEQAAERMKAEGTPAAVTTTLTRSRYWQEMFD